jgi:hypothetical protein
MYHGCADFRQPSGRGSLKMTSASGEAASASERLHTAGVFEFSQARSTILTTLGNPEGAGGQSGLEILQFTSAEFALLPIYLMPQTLTLPLVEPLSVAGWSALAAITKGSCSLANPYHDERNLVTFLGDEQKLRSFAEGRRLIDAGYPTGEPVSFGREIPDSQQPNWTVLASELQNQYRRANTTIGNAIAESGVVRLQTLLWTAKWATIFPQSEVNFLELARSLGIVEGVGDRVASETSLT